MKLASAIAAACLSLAAVPAVAQEAYGYYRAPGYPNTNPGITPRGFADAPPSKAFPPLTFGAAPTLGPSTHRRSESVSEPPQTRFKPYGDRSGMAGGGPGAYPSAPKPRGYIDIYGDKKSEHPFAF